MSNRFSCNFSRFGDFSGHWYLTDPYLGFNSVDVSAYYFFYCAQPNATSASIQNVKTNVREYYVKRLKLDYCTRFSSNDNAGCVMFFVLNVPQDYVPSKTGATLNLSELPNHTIPENVLYYDIARIRGVSIVNGRGFDISIDIKKPFRVLPSYKLVFVYYIVGTRGATYTFDGTAQVFFDVN